MGYTPVTPFRRLVDAAVLEGDRLSKTPLPSSGVNKWEALRELSVARAAYGLSDRDMTVLQALLSFHPETILNGNAGGLIVHASNEAICGRLNGMPCSTMRRHLARLVAAGVLVRRDSPNGKRYARKTAEGKDAFGFDLSPLIHHFPAFCQQAEAVRAEQDRFDRLRETVSLMRRDLAGLALYGEEVRPDIHIWTRLQDMAALTARAIKRRLSFDELESIHQQLDAALSEAREILEPAESRNMSTKDAENGHHYQNSNTNLHVFELRDEAAQVEAVGSDADCGASVMGEDELPLPFEATPRPKMPLRLVLSACEQIQLYAPDGIRHWHEFVRSADTVRPMMGISPSAWDDAKKVLGPEEAATVLAAILERFEDIRSPGGYLRSLVDKAALGAFSSGPMIMALMHKRAA